MSKPLLTLNEEVELEQLAEAAHEESVDTRYGNLSERVPSMCRLTAIVRAAVLRARRETEEANPRISSIPEPPYLAPNPSARMRIGG